MIRSLILIKIPNNITGLKQLILNTKSMYEKLLEHEDTL